MRITEIQERSELNYTRDYTVHTVSQAFQFQSIRHSVQVESGNNRYNRQYYQWSKVLFLPNNLEYFLDRWLPVNFLLNSFFWIENLLYSIDVLFLVIKFA